jgi:hypothetical protein
MTEAFISYSRKDLAFVKRLYEALKQQNREIWVDWNDIPLAADWRQEIFVGINQADNFVFVISPDSIVWREVPTSLIPDELNKFNWIFFRESDNFDQALRSLCIALDTDLEHVREHTRLLTRAIEWE